MRSISALLVFASAALNLRSQTLTSSEINLLQKESHAIGSSNLAALVASSQIGSMQAESFRFDKGKMASFEAQAALATGFSPSEAEIQTLKKAATGIETVQVATPTAVPEVPAYAAVMGLGTLAYVLFRNRVRLAETLASAI